MFLYQKGNFESKRKDASDFAKNKYFNGNSDNRSIQENFDLITSFIQESAEKHIPLKPVYYKKGDRPLACNDRPVSLTCVPCKLLEHIICSNIMTHLDEHKLLSDRQHAFQKKHSCETQLTTVIDDWARIVDKGGQVDTFILYFEKAFDTPPHELHNVSYMAMVLVGRL